MMMKILLGSIALCLSCTTPSQGNESVIKDQQGMDCFVYTPDVIDPAKIYQLIVGVHGAKGNGNGAAGMKDWAKRGDVIVIGPSFDIKNENPFQNGNGIHAEKLISLFEGLKKTYKLRDRMFLHGFSGGSQFTHRFTMLHPDLVCGTSSHSGGTWATDNYGSINDAAKKIPFAISCGEKDTGKSFPEAPYGRLEWHGRFKQEIDKRNFCYISATWPNVGHSMSAGAWDLTKQCFQLATGLPGQSATEPVAISDAWKNLGNIPGKQIASNPVTPPATSNKDIRAEVDKMVPAAFKRAESGKIPDDLLIGFMKKYPPSLWKDKPGSAKLVEQCKAAAGSWYKTAKEKQMLTAAMKQEFARFSDGLDLKVND